MTSSFAFSRIRGRFLVGLHELPVVIILSRRPVMALVHEASDVACKGRFALGSKHLLGPKQIAWQPCETPDVLFECLGTGHRFYVAFIQCPFRVHTVRLLGALPKVSLYFLLLNVTGGALK